MDTALKLLGEAILLAAGAVAKRPDDILSALIAAAVMALCWWLAGWAALAFWIFDR